MDQRSAWVPICGDNVVSICGFNLFVIYGFCLVLISMILLDWCGFDFAGFCSSIVGLI